MDASACDSEIGFEYNIKNKYAQSSPSSQMPEQEQNDQVYLLEKGPLYRDLIVTVLSASGERGRFSEGKWNLI